MSTARRMPPAERRAHLVDAALDEFARRHEEDVGLEDIAQAAGVTRNLLYRYFASRAEIQRAAVAEAIERVARRFSVDPAVPITAKLPRNVAMWLDAVAADDPAVLLIFRSAGSSDSEVAALVARAREALARAIARNHLGDGDPPAAVLAALDGYLVLGERLIDRWRDGDLTRPQVERVLADVLPILVASSRSG